MAVQVCGEMNSGTYCVPELAFMAAWLSPVVTAARGRVLMPLHGDGHGAGDSMQACGLSQWLSEEPDRIFPLRCVLG